jgi:gliding motility-associated-like protein
MLKKLNIRCILLFITCVFPYSVRVWGQDCTDIPVTFDDGAVNAIRVTAGIPVTAFVAASCAGDLSIDDGIFTYETVAGSLPGGVTLSSDGAFSGIPTAGTNNEYSFTVRATLHYGDGLSCHVEKSYTLTVECGAPPEFTISPEEPFVGAEYSGSLLPADLTYTGPISGELPPGLNAAGNTISGIPTQRGSYVFAVTAENAASGCIYTPTFDLDVRCNGITITNTDLSTSVGTEYNHEIAVEGHYGAVACSYAGSLPQGVTFTDGIFSGIPAQTGIFEGTISVTDGAGCESIPVPYTYSVTCPEIGSGYLSLTEAVFGGEYNGEITGVSGGTMPYTFTLLSPSSGDWSVSADGKISGTPSASGQAEIQVHIEDYYGCSTEAAYTITVNKADQTVDFTMPDGITYGDAPFVLTATATSGGTVLFESSNENVAVISGNMVTVVGAGEVTVTATQAGDNNYNPAGKPVNRTIGKASVTIAAGEQTREYGEDNPSLTYSHSELKNGDSFIWDSQIAVSVNADRTSPVSGSPYTIAVSGITESDKYAFNYVPGQLTVTKAPLTLTPDNKERYYLENDPDWTYNHSALKNGENIGQALTRQPAFQCDADMESGAGNYTITMSGASADNYSIAYGNGELTVHKANQAITFNSPDAKTYGDGAYSIASLASSTSGLPVRFGIEGNDGKVAVVTSGGNVTVTGAGTVTITAYQDGDNNFNPAESKSALLHVSPKVLKATPKNVSREYGYSNPLVYEIDYEGFVGTDNKNSIVEPVGYCAATPATGPGTYDITLSGGAAVNYTIEFVNGTLTVTCPAITLGSIATTAAAGESYSQAITASIASGENRTYFFEYSGTLPEGLVWSSTSTQATVSGTPVREGTFSFSVMATDRQYTACSAERQYTITVACGGGISFTATTLPSGEYGIAYNGSGFPVNVTGGVAPYRFTVSSGAIPGMSLSQTGTLAGTPSKAGFYDITIQVEDAAHCAQSRSFTSLEIEKADLHITANAQNRPFNENNPALTYTMSGVRFSDETMLRNRIFLTTTAQKGSNAGGTYPVSLGIGVADLDNYQIVYTPADLTVTKAAQIITFPDLPETVTYGDPDFAPGAASNAYAGLPAGQLSVEYSVSNPSGTEVIAVSADRRTIIVKNAGTATVTAIQNGDGNYNAATPVSRTVMVNKARLNVRAANASREYGDPNPGLAVEFTSGFRNNDTKNSLTNIPQAISDATASTPAGNYPIRVVAGEEKNYTYITAAGVLDITRAKLRLYANSVTRAFNTGNPEFTYTCAGLKNGENPGLVLNPQPSLVCAAGQSTPPGNYPIEISGGAAVNYEITGRTPGTLTISNKPFITVTVGNASKIYGDDNPSEYTVTYSGFIDGDDESVIDTRPVVSTDAGNRSGVGSYPVMAGGAQDGKYNFTYIAGALTVLKAPLTATVANAQKIYGTPDPAFAFNYVGWKNNDDESVLTAKPKASRVAGEDNNNVGYAIYKTECGSAANYEITCSDAEGILFILPADQNITGFDLLPVKTYKDNPFVLAAEASSGLAVSYTSDNTDVAEMSGNRVIIRGAGTARIKVSQAGNHNYNAAPDAEQTLTVNRVKQTIDFTLTPNRITYGDRPSVALSAKTYTGGTVQEGLPVTYAGSDENIAGITGNTLTVKGAGTVTVTAVQEGDSNHEPAESVSQILIIEKARPEIQIPRFTDITYGDPPIPVNAATSAGLPVTCSVDDEKIAVVDGSYLKIVGAGTANITFVCEGNNNYTDSRTTVPFTVKKATLVITAENKIRQQGRENPAFTFSYSGFVAGDDETVLSAMPVAECTANAGSPAGSVHPITVSGAEATNYRMEYREGRLTVTGKPVLQVSVVPAEREYGENNPAPFILQYSGFEPGDTEDDIDVKPVAVCNADAASPAGPYPVSVSGGKDPDYEFEYTNGRLTVKKAVLTVAAENASRFFGEENPAFTVTYKGFKNDDGISGLDRLPVASAAATPETPVGTVGITVEGGFDDCYDFRYEQGQLVIMATLAFSDQPAVVYGDDPFVVPVVVNGGIALAELEITLSPREAGQPVVQLVYDSKMEKWTAHIVSAGIVDVLAVFKGGQGRIGATATTSLEVRKKMLTATADDYERKQGEQNPDTWNISCSGFVYGEDAGVIDRLPVAVCDARPNSPVNEYIISVNGGSDNNYEFSYIDGTLRIVAAEKLPTAFTPNRDGINDVFAAGHKVQIFNRLGVLLFEGGNGWDGTYKGQVVVPGIYFYVSTSPQGQVQKGSIEVIRTK